MRKTNCSKCSEPLELDRIGKKRYCRKCQAENMRRNRKKHSELTPEQRKKANCRSATHTYLKRGKIIKGTCEVCNTDNVESHHDDYSKPKTVRWFCRKHHLLHHALFKVKV